MNLWLWPRLAPEVCDEQAAMLFVGIGTILTHHIPAKPVKMVFGSGCWQTGSLPTIDGRWKVYCVRSPLTAARLNLDPARELLARKGGLRFHTTTGDRQWADETWRTFYPQRCWRVVVYPFQHPEWTVTPASGWDIPGIETGAVIEASARAFAERAGNVSC